MNLSVCGYTQAQNKTRGAYITYQVAFNGYPLDSYVRMKVGGDGMGTTIRDMVHTGVECMHACMRHERTSSSRGLIEKLFPQAHIYIFLLLLVFLALFKY